MHVLFPIERLDSPSLSTASKLSVYQTWKLNACFFYYVFFALHLQKLPSSSGTKDDEKNVVSFPHHKQIINQLLAKPPLPTGLFSRESSRASLVALAKGWVHHHFSTCSYPLRERPPLFSLAIQPGIAPLPKAFTSLHASIIPITADDHPAICMRCGLVLNGGGKGECVAHLATCPQRPAIHKRQAPTLLSSPFPTTVGIFILLHDHTLLLFHYDRAAYYPSPYVDPYGEKHSQYRGRPMFLEARKVRELKSLVMDHRISQEVVGFRTTANRVVILGYY